MNNLSIFSFEAHDIRFVGTAIDPWWVAADVCKALEITNPSMAIGKLDDDEKRHDITLNDVSGKFTSTRVQKVWCVNEPGLYSLVLTSRKPSTRRFKKWLTQEVIPAIRRTGSYGTPTNTPPTPAKLNTAFAAKVAELAKRKELLSERIDATSKSLKVLQEQYSLLDQEYSRLYVEHYRHEGEEYIKHKQIVGSHNPYVSKQVRDVEQ
ncbi:BRO-N domain-containing protein [Nostoc sp.]|uniref:BRO-N domain-containing protein n=1 Tax=Nostoc sp. TaxID=1180 RepID=UPI002FF749A0